MIRFVILAILIVGGPALAVRQIAGMGAVPAAALAAR